MKVVLFLFFVALMSGQIHISVFDSETNSPVSNFFYKINGRSFYADSHSIRIDSLSHVTITHVSYEDTTFYPGGTQDVYLTPKIFTSRVDVISSKISSNLYVEKINLTESKNSTLGTIDKLIEELPSVQITDYGGGGAAKTLRIKGSSDRHNVILFDGIPINSVQNAWSNLGNVPLANASSISLFKTGSSCSFGPNALSGALNISFIPRFTNKTNFVFTHSIQLFERNRTEFSKKLENSQFFNIEKNEVDGSETSFKLNVPINLFDQSTLSIGSNIEKSDNDFLFENGNYYRRIGNDHLRKNVNIGFNAIKGKLQFGSVFLHGKNEAGAPGTATDYTKPLIDKNARQEDDTTFLLGKLSYFYNSRSTFFYTSSYSSQLLLYQKTNTHQNKSYTQKFEYHLSLNRIKHISIIDVNHSYLKSSSVGEPERIRYSYAMTNEILLLDKNFYELYTDVSFRSDWYKDKLNSIEAYDAQRIQDYQIRLVSENNRLWARYSKNYSIPTFNDLFWPKWGNPDLEIEYSDNWDLGLSSYFKRKYMMFKSEVSYFKNSFNDLIRWIPQGSIWRPVNLEEVEQSGLDLSLKLTFDKEHSVLNWLNVLDKLDITFSYLRNINEEIIKSTNRKRQLAYTPKHIYNINVSTVIDEHFYIRYWLKNESEQLGVNGDQIFGSRSVSNIFVHYIIKNDRFSIKPFIEIRNLTNNYYDVRPGYPMPNRTFRFGIQLNY